MYNPVMKLPRWLVIGLWTSSVLAVLAAAGWWWVTWPERTAREFIEHGAAGRWYQVGSMSGWSSEFIDQRVVPYADTDPRKWSLAAFKPEPRTLKDILQGNGLWVSDDYLFVEVKRDKLQSVNISSRYRDDVKEWLRFRQNRE